MAFDTKPNLNDNKFEQFPGEVLSLSGCTDIFGELEIKSAGSFILADGSEGTDYFMTSDAAGKGTWNNIAVITGGTNGLTKLGKNLELGGSLSKTTNVLTAGYVFKIRNTDSDTSSVSHLVVADTGVGLQGLASGTDYSVINVFDTGLIKIARAISSTEYTVEMNAGGFYYGGCYHAGYTDRSLVDKEYVDACAGASGIQSANNGLTKSGTNVHLGGTLTGTTTIDFGTAYNFYICSSTYPTRSISIGPNINEARMMWYVFTTADRHHPIDDSPKKCKPTHTSSFPSFIILLGEFLLV